MMTKLKNWLRAQALVGTPPELTARAERRALSLFVTEYSGEQPQWTPEMAEGWRHFLASNEAGKTLQRLGNYHEQQTNRAAVFRSSDAAAANAGYARGWHDATAYFFQTLSAEVRPQQDPDTQPPSDAEALRERLAS